MTTNTDLLFQIKDALFDSHYLIAYEADIRDNTEFRATQSMEDKTCIDFTVFTAEVDLSDDTTIKLKSTSPSIIAPSFCIDLKTIPSRYVYVSPVPKDHVSIVDWAISKQSLCEQPPIQFTMRLALKLVDAIIEMHSTCPSSFLVDLSLQHSIWISKDNESIKLIVREKLIGIERDKQSIYWKYIHQLRGVSVSLQPPEMLNESLSIRNQKEITRSPLSDSWAFGVILLLLLRCDYMKIPQETFTLKFIKHLICEKSDTSGLLFNLFKGIFAPVESRFSPAVIREMIQNIIAKERENTCNQEDIIIEIKDFVCDFKQRIVKTIQPEDQRQIIQYTSVLKNKIREDNSNREYIMLLTQIFELNQVFSSAKFQYNKLLKINQEDFEAQLSLGIVEYNQGEYANALSLFEKCVSYKFEHNKLKYFLGLTHMKMKDYRKAIIVLKLYLKKDKTNSLIIEALSHCLVQVERRQEAYTVLEGIANLSPKYRSLKRNLELQYNQILQKEITGKKVQAKDVSQQFYRLGCAMQGCENYIQAIKAYERSISANKKSLYSIIGLCECYLKVKNMKEACRVMLEMLPLIDEKVKENPDPYSASSKIFVRGYIAAARIYQQRGNLGFAIRSYWKSIKLIDEYDDGRRNVLGEFLGVLKYFLDNRIKECSNETRNKSLNHEFKFSQDVLIEAARIEDRYRASLLVNKSHFTLRGSAQRALHSIAYEHIAKGQNQMAMQILSVCEEINSTNLSIKFDIQTLASVMHANNPQKLRNNLREWDDIIKSGRLTQRKRALHDKDRLEQHEITDVQKSRGYFNKSQLQFSIDASSEDAFISAKQCLVLDSSNADYYYNLARIQFQQNRSKLPSDAINSCLKIDNKHVQMIRLMQEMYGELGYPESVSESEFKARLTEAESEHATIECIMRREYKKSLQLLKQCAQINRKNEIVRKLALCDDVLVRLKEFNSFVLKSDILNSNDLRKQILEFNGSKTAECSIASLLKSLGFIESEENEISKEQEAQMLLNYTFNTREVQELLTASLPSELLFPLSVKPELGLYLVKILLLHGKIEDTNRSLILEYWQGLSEEEICHRFNFKLIFAQSLLIDGIKNFQGKSIHEYIDEARADYLQLCLKSTSEVLQQRGAIWLADLYLVAGGDTVKSKDFLERALQPQKGRDDRLVRYLQSLLGMYELPVSSSNSDISKRMNELLHSCQQIGTEYRMFPLLNECVLDKQGHQLCRGFCSFSQALKFKAKKKYEKATKQAKHAIEQNDSIAVLSYVCCQLLVKMQQYDEAERIVARIDDSIALGLSGVIASRRGDVGCARELLFAWVKSTLSIDEKESLQGREGESDLLAIELARKSITDGEQMIVDEISSVFEKSNQFEQAESIYKLSIQRRPTHIYSYFALAKLLLDQNKSEEAYSQMQISLQMNEGTTSVHEENDSEDNWLQLGLLLKSIGKYADALTALNKCVSRHKNHPTAYGVMGDCLVAMDSNDVNQLESIYRKQLKITRNNIECHVALGNLLLKKGDNTAANQVLRDALQYADKAQKESLYEQIIAMSEPVEGKLLLALHILNQYGEDFPEKKPAILLRVARLYLYRAKDLLMAISVYEQYLKLDDKNLSIMFTLGCLYMAMNQIPQAEIHFMAMLQQDAKMYEVHFKLSTVFIKREEYSLARSSVLAGLELNPTHPQGLANYGYVLLKEKKYAQALEVYEDCMHYSDGRLTEILQQIGKVYKKLGMHEESEACLIASLKYYPLNLKTKLKLVQSYLIQKKYADALSTLNSNWGGDYLNTHRTYYLGETYFQLHEYEKSYAEFKKLLQRFNNKRSVMIVYRLYRQHILEFRQNDWIEKMKLLIPQIKTKSPNNLDLIYHILIDIYLWKGDYDNVAEMMKHLKEMNADLAELHMRSAIYILRTQNSVEKAMAELELVSIDHKIRELVEFKLVKSEILLEMRDFSAYESEISSIDKSICEGWVIQQMTYLEGVAGLYQDRNTEEVRELFQKNKLHLCSMVRLSQMLVTAGDLAQAEAVLREDNKQYLDNIYWLKEMGRVSFLLGKNKVGIEIYQRFQNIYQRDVDVSNKLAQEFLDVGQRAQAEKLIQECCLKIQPVAAITYLIQARLYIQKLEFHSALTSIEEYIQMKPDCVDGYVTLGKIQRSQNNREEEKIALEKGDELMPGNIKILISLGEVYMVLEQLDKLKETIVKIQKLDVEEFYVNNPLGIWLNKIGDIAQAEVYLAQCYAEKPAKEGILLVLYIQVMYDLGKLEAIASLLESNKKAKLFDPIILHSISKYYYDQGKYADAIHWMRKTKRESEQVILQKHLFVTHAAYLSKNYALVYRCARRSWKKSVDKSTQETSSQMVFYNTIISADKKANLRKCIRTLQRLFDEVKQARILVVLGHWHVELNQFARAEECLEQALSMNENEPLAETLRALLDLNAIRSNEQSSEKETKLREIENNLTAYIAKVSYSEYASAILGSTQLMQKKYGKAINTLEQCLSLEKTVLKSLDQIPLSKDQWNHVRYELALAYREIGSLVKAIQYIESMMVNRSIFHLPIEINLLLARLYFENSQITEAQRILHKYIFKQDVNEKFLFLYAEIQLKQGYIEDALSALKKSIAVNPEYVEAHILIALTKKRYSAERGLDGLRQVLKLDPSNVEVLLELMQSMIQLNDFTEFDGVFQEYHRICPKLTPEIITINAIRLTKQDRVDEAHQTLEEGIREYPNNMKILMGMAQVYKHSNNSAEEAKVYERMLKIPELKEAKTKEIQLQLAHCKLINGDFAAAETMYQALFASADEFEDDLSYSDESIQNLGLCLLAQNKYDLAVEKLKKMQYSGSKMIFLMAFAYSKLGNVSAAILMYQKCIDINPSFVEAAVNLSVLYRKTEQFNEAQTVLQKIGEFNQHKHLGVSFHLALTHYARHAYSSAIHLLQTTLKEYVERHKITSENTNPGLAAFRRVFKASIKQDLTHDSDLARLIRYSSKECPDIVSFNLLLDVCLRKSSRYDDAIMHMQKCSHLEPENEHYAYSLALSYYKIGKLSQAVAEIKRCQKLNPQHSLAYQFALSNMLHHTNLNEYELALLEECSSGDEIDCYEVLINLGCAYFSRKLYGKAVEAFSKAVELRPQDQIARFNLGNALMFTADIRGAIQSYKECLNINFNNQKCLQNLASAYVHNKQLKEGIECLQKCIEINPFDTQDVFLKMKKWQVQLFQEQCRVDK